MTLLLLFACDGATRDSADPADDDRGDDTAEPPAEPIAFVGAEGAAAGAALSGADGVVAIGATMAGQVCVLAGPFEAGVRPLDERATCYAEEGFAEFAGWAVAFAGDVDHDGQPELLASALGNADGGYLAGKAYLLEGPWDGAAHSLGEARAAFVGEEAGDYLGASLASPGDVDGDGDPELLLGAYGNDAAGPEAGRVYLFRGPVADGTRDVSEADATFIGDLPEETAAPPHNTTSIGDAIGSAVAGAGDFDGDGLADLLLGIDANDRGGDGAGAVALYFGPLDDGANTLDDADRVYVGAAGEYAGWAVAGVGDTDGDGLSEVAVAGDTEGSGRIWILPGPGTPGQAPLADAPAVITGEATHDLNLPALAAPGDADGDGLPDLLVGACFHDAAGEDAGSAFLVSAPFPQGTSSLADAARVRSGDLALDQAGEAVGGAGDVDGDGVMDLLVGAPTSDAAGHGSGKVWLILGGD